MTSHAHPARGSGEPAPGALDPAALDPATSAPADLEAADVVRRYERFALHEAPGRSALYEEWALGVASTPEVCRVLARIPPTRRQPPLVFAVARLLGAPLASWEIVHEWMLQHADALVAECSRRGVQTNEPQRCAALLPALSLIEGPIALLEVGASAGLCLFPDRYSYRYRDADGGLLVRVDPAAAADPSAELEPTATADPSSELDPGPSPDDTPNADALVVLDCELRGPVPPLRLPEIVWRAGIDLQPVDARDPAGRAWITGLVWPGETGRAERITRALNVVAGELEAAGPGTAPLVREGDAAELLAKLAAEAPSGATLVVTTPGVLAHVPWAARLRIIETATALPGHWITLDNPGLHEAWHPPIDLDDWPAGGFALAIDGIPVAAVDPLGSWVAWRGLPTAGAPTLET